MPIAGLDADPRLSELKCPANAPLSKQLWELLCTREATSAAEAFASAELPAVAGLSGLLVKHFPAHVFDESFRKEAGWLVRRVMEGLGYEFHRKDVQINLPGIFTTGAIYCCPEIPMRDRSQRINRVQRDAWAKARIASN